MDRTRQITRIAQAFEATGCDYYVDGFISESDGLCERLAEIAVDALTEK